MHKNESISGLVVGRISSKLGKVPGEKAPAAFMKGNLHGNGRVLLFAATSFAAPGLL